MEGEQEVSWTVTESSGKTSIQGSVKQLNHRDPLEATDKTPKGQIDFIVGWNEMRKCLLDNGLMKQK